MMTSLLDNRYTESDFMPAFINNFIQGAKQKIGSLLGALKNGLVSTTKKIYNNPKKVLGASALALTALDCYLDRPTVPQAIGTFVVISAPIVTMYLTVKTGKFIANKVMGLAAAPAAAPPPHLG